MDLTSTIGSIAKAEKAVFASITENNSKFVPKRLDDVLGEKDSLAGKALSLLPPMPSVPSLDSLAAGLASKSPIKPGDIGRLGGVQINMSKQKESLKSYIAGVLKIDGGLLSTKKTILSEEECSTSGGKQPGADAGKAVAHSTITECPDILSIEAILGSGPLLDILGDVSEMGGIVKDVLKMKKGLLGGLGASKEILKVSNLSNTVGSFIEGNLGDFIDDLSDDITNKANTSTFDNLSKTVKDFGGDLGNCLLDNNLQKLAKGADMKPSSFSLDNLAPNGDFGIAKRLNVVNKLKTDTTALFGGMTGKKENVLGRLGQEKTGMSFPNINIKMTRSLF